MFEECNRLEAEIKRVSYDADARVALATRQADEVGIKVGGEKRDKAFCHMVALLAAANYIRCVSFWLPISRL